MASDAAHARAEDELETIKGRYEQILQSAGDGIFGIDGEGRVTFVNPAAANMLGYSSAALVGKDHHETFHAKRADGSPLHRDDSPILATIRDGAAHHVRGGEVFWTSADRPVPVEYVSAPMREGGKITGATIIFKNNEERERSERALRESEERFRRLSDATQEGIVITEHGKILDVNSIFASMFGYEVGEIVGKSAIDVVAPESRDAVSKAIRTNAEGPYEATGLRKDGTTFPIEASAKSMPYQGRSARVAAIRDLTDRRRAEAESKRIVQFYENIPDAFFVMDRDWRIVYLNPVATRMASSQARAQYMGHALWDLFPDLKGTRFDTEYHRAMAERVPVRVEEFFRPSKQWFEANAYPFDGGLSVFFRDITARKKTEDKLREESVSRPLVRKLVQDLVDIGGVPHMILQQVGRKLATETDATDLDAYIEAYATMGLGTLKLERTEEGRFTFVGTDLLEKRVGSRVATCYFTLGYLGEVVSRVREGEPTLGTEIECESRGSHRCKFIVQVRKPEEGLARRVKELV